MSKRKRSEVDDQEPRLRPGQADFTVIANVFNAFVKSLATLMRVTPAENFSTKGLSTEVEDRAVIAKVLKRMQLKGQLSWMDQYLENENLASRAPEIGSSEASGNSARDAVGVVENKVVDVPNAARLAQWPPTLPPIRDEALLKQAFTHRSYATALAPAKSSKVFLTSLHNERLEFLGDSFLNHAVTKILFARMPDAREGELSLLRAELIGNNVAAEFGRLYNFDSQLLLNDTAERDGVRKTPKVIADTFEAYLGALILDGKDGVIRADDWLKALMNPRVEEYLANKVDEPVNPYAKQKVFNHFSRMYPPSIEETDGTLRSAISIKYEWVDGGGGNEGGFVIAAQLFVPSHGITNRELGRGFGLNKKEAEHRAAMEVAKIYKL